MPPKDGDILETHAATPVYGASSEARVTRKQGLQGCDDDRKSDNERVVKWPMDR